MKCYFLTGNNSFLIPEGHRWRTEVSYVPTCSPISPTEFVASLSELVGGDQKKCGGGDLKGGMSPPPDLVSFTSGKIGNFRNQ